MSSYDSIRNAEEGCLIYLHYFGIFKYPLTLEEIHRFNPFKTTIDEVESVLSKQLDVARVFVIDQFYMKENEPSWVAERIAGEERARKLLGKAKKFVKIISAFPFVRGIAISGSLSKFYASENPDIDYFIITEKNRLWIARSFLHMFKKLTFITGHQHYFCMNYFIDTEALTIEHPNLYSAIEVKTLLPTYNEDILRAFHEMNTWSDDILPNHRADPTKTYLLKERKEILKSFFEWILNVLAPDRFNRFLMHLTDKKWRNKWKHAGYSKEEYNRAFRTSIHISKNHPTDYEKKVLESLP